MPDGQRGVLNSKSPPNGSDRGSGGVLSKQGGSGRKLQVLVGSYMLPGASRGLGSLACWAWNMLHFELCVFYMAGITGYLGATESDWGLEITIPVCVTSDKGTVQQVSMKREVYPDLMGNGSQRSREPDSALTFQSRKSYP